MTCLIQEFNMIVPCETVAGGDGEVSPVGNGKLGTGSASVTDKNIEIRRSGETQNVYGE